MDTPSLVPLAIFALVVLIVAITGMVKLRDKEMEVYQSLHVEELEHRRKMEELQQELNRVRQGLSTGQKQATVPSEEARPWA